MSAASQPQMPAPPVYAPPPPVEPTKEEPWGPEDPLLWSAGKARTSAIWGSAAVALFVFLYGLGMYLLISDLRLDYEVDSAGPLIILFLTPFFLSVIAAVGSWRLAKYVGIMSRQPLAPEGSRTARGILWLSVFLWGILWLAFLVAILTTIDREAEDGGFPWGMVTSFPAYLGLCIGVYATGAAYSTWSRNNKVESLLIIGLAWAAFAMFLLLPAVIGSWNLEAESPDVNWDSVVWWLRFGSLFPAIAPWLIVFGLYFVHTRNIQLLEEEVEGDMVPPPTVAPAGTTTADSCPSCGGSLSVHPRTLEVFCAACGWGLRPEAEGPLVVDASPAPTHADDLFVEQAPVPAAADAATASVDPGFCGDCGTKRAVLSKTGQVYCPGCGAGLPVQEKVDVPAPSPIPTAVPAPTPAPSSPVVQTQPVHTQAPQASDAAPPPAPASDQSPRAVGNCPLCGAMLAIHPRTGERFCPACGAGLRQEQ